MTISVLFLASCENENLKTVVGLVETTEIDIAPKIPGRIDSVFVSEGSIVKKGQVIAKLEPETIDAKVAQAKSVMEAAKAKVELVHKGAREKEKQAYQKLYNQAKEQFDYAAKTYSRFQSLFKDSVISNQEMDEMTFKYNAAKEQMDAARLKYEIVVDGARKEEISAVEALFRQAENGYREALSYQTDLYIKAPADGEIQSLIADRGEVIAAGYPVASMIVPEEAYVVVHLREDYLKDLTVGKKINCTVPALDNQTEEFVISYIAPMADFATWKPTNQKGDFDLKSFEVRLKSPKAISNLRPGMTVRMNIN